MVKRIISVLGIFVILFSNCLSVHADIVDSGSYIASNFWDFLSGNEYDYNLDFWKNVTGYFVGKECPSSPDSYHHGPKPAFGSSSGGSDENGRFGWATCEYCGNLFKVYSSFTPNSSGFGGKSDLQQSYDSQVAELPAPVYTSAGEFSWKIVPHVGYVCGSDRVSGERFIDYVRGVGKAKGGASSYVSFILLEDFVAPVDGVYSLTPKGLYC